MRIVPVLDIKGGVVVRGVMGDRANYRPIATPLSATPAPLDVARGLMGLFPFEALYLADLDAIEGRIGNAPVYAALAAAYPAAEIWVDAGTASIAAVAALLAFPGVTVVLGSESVESAAVIEAFSDEPRAVLSLDYRGETFMGPEGIEDRPEIWPARVIAMTLAKVGSDAGPDSSRLARVVGMAAARAVFAAGGVRGPQDLAALAEAGVAGALVASALHDGRIGPEVLARLSGGRSPGSITLQQPSS